MTPKKPDRFERIVLAAIKKQDTPESPSVWLNGPDIVTLLRQEHRWMVGVVHGQLRQCHQFAETYSYGRELWMCRAAQCHDILDRLTRRAK